MMRRNWSCIFKEYGEERFSRQIAAPSWRVETRSRLPPPHSSTVWSMKWCRKPTARRAIPPNASSRRCALKSTANWTSSPPHCRRPRTDCMSGDDWWWSPIIRSKTKPSNRSWHKGCEWMFRLACLSYRRNAQPFFTDLTRGAIKADEHEIAANPRSASVRLRAVEVSREIPSRWRKRFTQTAQGLNDVKIQGSASPGRAKNTARIRTRRG